MLRAIWRSNRYTTLPVNREHLFCVPENPLLVRVGGEVVGGGVVRSHVVEEPAVLRPHKLYKQNVQLPEIVQTKLPSSRNRPNHHLGRRVLWAVGPGVGEHG